MSITTGRSPEDREPETIGGGSGFEKASAPPLVPRRPHKPDGPSPVVAGGRGLSREAVALFDHAQRAGGTLQLNRFGSRSRLGDLLSLADELVAFDVVRLAGYVLTIVDAHANDNLIPGGDPGGWSRMR